MVAGGLRHALPPSLQAVNPKAVSSHDGNTRTLYFLGWYTGFNISETLQPIAASNGTTSISLYDY